MQHIRKLLDEAKVMLLRADHLAFTAYPQIKEPKLLALIVENVDVVFSNCMGALLYNERMYKRVDPGVGDFDSEVGVFSDHCVRRYGLPAGCARMVKDVRSLADKKKACPVEFARKDMYVLCSDSYKMDSLDIRTVKGFVDCARQLLDRTSEVFGDGQ